MMKKAYYKIIIFFMVPAFVQICCAAFVPFASIRDACAATGPASSSRPAGKIAVYEAIMKYCKIFDKDETDRITGYINEAVEADEKTLKMLEEKLGDRAPAYEVMLSIADGLPAMFRPLAAGERDFIFKNFNNNSLRLAVKLIAGGARFLAAKGKCIPSSRALFTACLLALDFESASMTAPSGGGFLITKMISVACQKICLETLIRVILNGEFNEKYCVNFYKSFEFIDGSQLPLSKTMDNEFIEIKRIIGAYSSLDAELVKELKDPFYPPEVFAVVSAEIKKSPFAVKVAGLYADEAIAQVGGIFSMYNEAFKKPYKEASAIFDAIDKNFRDGKYNNFFTQVGVPNMGRANWQAVRNMAVSDMAKTSVLLKLYKLANGKFPAKPGGLTTGAAGLKVPKDRFSGEELIYQRLADDRFILVSVGPNMLPDAKYDEKYDQSAPSLASSDDIVMDEKHITIK